MIRKALGVAASVCLPTVSMAEQGIVLTFGLGPELEPEYFGSDDYETSLGFLVEPEYIGIGGLRLGNPDPDAIDQGLRIGPSFRIVDERDSSDFPELAGLDDIDATVEIGVGIRYDWPSYRAFADLRYGIGGHESLVGEVGGDVVVRPNDRLTLTAGPRVLIGSDDYASTYFGITATEAGASGLPAYEADGGVLSAGVELGMSYQFNDDWGVRGAIGYSRLMGDAADSPITEQGSRTQGSASVMLTRRVTLGF